MTTPDRSYSSRRTKILAISSAGGHWIQLLRLKGALVGFDVTYVTTQPANRSMVPNARFHTVTDANRRQKLRLIWLVVQLIWIIWRNRPTVILTTGAAPGYLAVRIGKYFGARTLWLDSIANAEELSLSGRLAAHHADALLTQWSHLAGTQGALFRGAVL